MRKGKIRDSAARLLDAPAERPDAEVLADFLGGFYEDRETPTRLLLPAAPARLTGLQTLLGWAKVRVLARPSCAGRPTTLNPSRSFERPWPCRPRLA